MIKKNSFSLLLAFLLGILLSCSRKPAPRAEFTFLDLRGAPLAKSAEGYLAAPEKPVLFEIPCWWEGNRPPSGQVVVLEIEYTDSARLPVRVQSYSGLGYGETFSELHRFGGYGDSRQAIARVPASSGLLFRYQTGGTARFQVSSDSGAVKIKSVRLTEPLPDEEERYNEETRAWVRRVQQAKARTAPEYYEWSEEASLGDEWQNKPLVPFQRPWMDLVMTNSAPRSGETNFPLKVRLTRNEYEPLQIGIYANGGALNEVKVTVDPVTGPDGEKVARASVRVAEYSLIDSRISGLEVEPFPLRLWPAFQFDVPVGRSRLVRVEFQTEVESAVPGSYTTNVRINARGVPETMVPVELEILPVELLSMAEAGLSLGGHILGLVPEHDLAFQRLYNHNLAAIYLLPQLSSTADGGFEMDFSRLDDWMAAAGRQGFETVYLFLGGNPFGFPRTMSLERQLATRVLGLEEKRFVELALEKPDSVHPKIAPLYEEWARRLGEHAEANGWPEIVLTPFDEPNKWSATREPLGSLAFIKPHFIHSADLLRRGWPGVQVAADMYTYDKAIVFLPHLEIYSTNSVHINPSLTDEVLQAGKKLWEYSTVDVNASFNRYTVGFFFGAHFSSAAHLWAYNWSRRFDTLSDPNWQYAWYTPFSAVPTPCLEGLREGLDDRRLVETLKRAAAEKGVDVQPLIDSINAEAVSLQEELRFFVIAQWSHASSGREFTIEDLRDYERKAEIMYRWHDRLLEKLLSLQ